MKQLLLLSGVLLCSITSFACGIPFFGNQLNSYTQYKSSYLFGNSAYGAMQKGTGLVLATQIRPMNSFNSFSAYTPLKGYKLQLGYSEMSGEYQLGQNVSFGVSRKFTFADFALATGIKINGSKNAASFSALGTDERFNFKTSTRDFERVSNQFLTTEIGTVLEYKNLTALLSVGNFLLKSAEFQMVPKTWNAGLIYAHNVKSLTITHGLSYNKQAYLNQLSAFSSGTYKFLELGFGCKVGDTRVSGFIMMGAQFKNFELSYTYSGAGSASVHEVPQVQQSIHEASLAWNIHK